MKQNRKRQHMRTAFLVHVEGNCCITQVRPNEMMPNKINSKTNEKEKWKNGGK
jgi:hypothetical protein